MGIVGFKKAPVEIRGFRDADAGTCGNIGGISQVDFNAVADRSPVESKINSKCLTEFAGAGTELSKLLRAAAFFHGSDTRERLERADKHCADMIFVGRNVDTVIGAVDVINVNIAVCFKHDGRARRLAITMGGGIIGVGFHFDNAAGVTPDLQDATDQFRGNIERGASEKRRLEEFRQCCCGEVSCGDSIRMVWVRFKACCG